MNRYLFLLSTLLASPAMAGDLQPLAEVKGNPTGYGNIESTLSALRSDPDVVERKQQGWLIFEDRRHLIFWSFPPEGHPAYPSAVKREIVNTGSGVHMSMSVQCGATKKACDQLVRDFQELNEEMSKAIQADKAGQEP